MKRILSITFIGIILSCAVETTPSEIDIFDVRYDSLMLSQESFEEIGFKISKEYDVSNLPDALGAYYGFWGQNDFERREFEIRFYPSNEIAKSSGKFFAEEATGEDAIIKKSDATWKEGVKDRRFVGPFGTSKNRSKYLDYVFFGNIIILCPSEKSRARGAVGAADPLENCRNLISKLSKVKK